MNPDDVFRRYQELQDYIGWCDDSAHLVAGVANLLEPTLPGLVEDFYAEIARHPAASKVITGGQVQVDRLKGTLLNWLRELLSGRYDREYAARRWRVGSRHVEIGLDQVYTNVALSRLRARLIRGLEASWPGDPGTLRDIAQALGQLIDLDLALIEDAYQTEYASRIQRGERLAAIGQLGGGVAHELRNPLNVIKTSVYYLLNARNLTAEKRAEHLARIERHVTLADEVITALSNFARMPVPSLRSFDVEACLREALELNAPPERCRASTDFPQPLPPGLADPDQVKIVFANLIRNAWEAMPAGGELAISARPNGGRIEVSMRDEGVGIEPDQLARVMEPLHTTKARGLGLGLAIARSITEKNEGTLRATSEFGRGSTFVVQLRAAPWNTGGQP